MISVVFKDSSNELCTSFERCLLSSSPCEAVAVSPPPPLSTSRGEAVTFGTFFAPRLNSMTE